MKSLLATILLVLVCAHAASAQQAQESVYDRVMRTGTIRCGYIVWGDMLKLDPNTGKMSGLSYAFMNAIGKELGLKIEWTEETGWGTFAQGLNDGRYDAMCGLVWQSGDRAKAALLTKPVAFAAMYAFAREDDSRFESDLASLDSPEATIAVIEGDPSQDIRASRFPKARELPLSPSTDPGALMLTIATRKADIVLVDSASVDRYNAQDQTTKLKFAGGGEPIRLYADVYAVKNGEERLKYLLDTAIDIINTSGDGPAIIAPYAPAFLPAAPAYAGAQKKQ